MKWPGGGPGGIAVANGGGIPNDGGGVGSLGFRFEKYLFAK